MSKFKTFFKPIKTFLKQLTMDYTTQKQNLISATINTLTQPNNTVTTLEVKTRLRTDYPEFYWTQQEISDTMRSMEIAGTLNVVDDNGTYRTYSLPTYVAPTPVQQDVVKTMKAKGNKYPISKSKAIEVIQNSAGKFISIEFIKKDNTDRKLNGKYLSLDQLGYIKFKTNKGEIKNINLQTLHTIHMAGDIYKVA